LPHLRRRPPVAQRGRGAPRGVRHGPPAAADRGPAQHDRDRAPEAPPELRTEVVR
ncbi:MAG: hypothetical protein RLY18_1429, partial [Pseudomonadota bacterium]